jgi:dipeptidyl aminopeptidase/acylaminoacyl peptidase
VYALRGVLFAVPFDPVTLKVRGTAVAVVEGVRRGTGIVSPGTSHVSVSSNGTLAYLTGPVSPSVLSQLTLASFDRSGGEQILKVPPGPYSEPRMSPDGRYLAFGSDDGRDVSIWVYDLKVGGSPRRLTFGGRDRYTVWSADSRRVTFSRIAMEIRQSTGSRLTDRVRPNVSLSRRKEVPIFHSRGHRMAASCSSMTRTAQNSR